MNSILKEIVDYKRGEIKQARLTLSEHDLERLVSDATPPLDFLAVLRKDGVGLIAEVKRASPSAGLIREDFDHVEIAKTYAANGAACISVLTDENFFQGDLQFLRDIRSQVDIPLLRKDFILDRYQVLEARAAGADAVLLIAECLSADELKALFGEIESLGMTALVELYDPENLPAVLACNPKLVGVNNRDLNTFKTRLEHSIELRSQVPEPICFVSESGIYTHEDVLRLEAAHVDAMLVGESLMRSEDIGLAVRALLGR